MARVTPPIQGSRFGHRSRSLHFWARWLAANCRLSLIVAFWLDLGIRGVEREDGDLAAIIVTGVSFRFRKFMSSKRHQSLDSRYRRSMISRAFHPLTQGLATPGIWLSQAGGPAGKESAATEGEAKANG